MSTSQFGPCEYVAAVGSTHSGTGREEDTTQLRRIYGNFCNVYGDLPSATRTKLAVPESGPLWRHEQFTEDRAEVVGASRFFNNVQ